VATRAVSSAYCADWTCRKNVGVLFGYRLNSAGPHQRAWHNMWTWETGRTFGMFGSRGIMVRFSPEKMGSSGRLFCGGGL
jgi:hypothetical protein